MPMANPTLDKNLGYVKEWYIEYDDVEEYANRRGWCGRKWLGGVQSSL